MCIRDSFGSVQINNPNSSILAAAGETGIPGLIILAMIYGLMVRRSMRYLRTAKKERDEVMLPLASAFFVGAVYLCLISPLDNYLEIARVTIPVWLLFWTVSTLTRQRRERDVMDYYREKQRVATLLHEESQFVEVEW